MSPKERGYSIVDRLGMMPDRDREYLWGHLTDYDKQELGRLTPGERRALMPERMQAERSTCCCSMVYRQEVYYWPQNGRPESFGWVACCSAQGCGKAVGELKVTGRSPEGFSQDTWRLMLQQGGVYGRFYCKTVDGKCVPHSPDKPGGFTPRTGPTVLDVAKFDEPKPIPKPAILEAEGFIEDPEEQ